MDSTGSDRIEKNVLLRATRERVWRAITDSSEFGAWFRADFEGNFAVETTVSARSTYPGHEDAIFEVIIEEMDPERLFSFRWYPSTPDSTAATSNQTTTLVEFRLEDAPEGTLLTMIESGFMNLPSDRRDETFRSNDNGWTAQMINIQRHVED